MNENITITKLVARFSEKLEAMKEQGLIYRYSVSCFTYCEGYFTNYPCDNSLTISYEAEEYKPAVKLEFDKDHPYSLADVEAFEEGLNRIVSEKVKELEKSTSQLESLKRTFGL